MRNAPTIMEIMMVVQSTHCGGRRYGFSSIWSFVPSRATTGNGRMGGSRTPFTQEGLDNDGQYLQMDSQAVFKWAVRLLDESITAVLNESNLVPGDVDLVVLHQANVRIVYAATDVLGIDRKRVFLNLDRYGNTSAGSVPLALDEAYQQGRIRRGDRILLSGFGAGLAWGTALLRW